MSAHAYVHGDCVLLTHVGKVAYVTDVYTHDWLDGTVQELDVRCSDGKPMRVTDDKVRLMVPAKPTEKP